MDCGLSLENRKNEAKIYTLYFFVKKAQFANSTGRLPEGKPERGCGT